MDPNAGTTSPAPDPADAKARSNNLYVTCDDLTVFSYNSNYLSVTSNQPHDTPYSNGSGPTGWQAVFYCGRHKSSPVATDFDNWVANGGSAPASQHEFCTFAPLTTSTPSSLNFAFGMDCTFSVNGNTYNTTLYFGQGSTSPGVNNWWIGGQWVSNMPGKSPVLTVYDSNGNGIQWYAIKSASLNEMAFTVQPS